MPFQLISRAKLIVRNHPALDIAMILYFVSACGEIMKFIQQSITVRMFVKIFNKFCINGILLLYEFCENTFFI